MVKFLQPVLQLAVREPAVELTPALDFELVAHLLAADLKTVESPESESAGVGSLVA